VAKKPDGKHVQTSASADSQSIVCPILARDHYNISDNQHLQRNIDALFD